MKLSYNQKHRYRISFQINCFFSLSINETSRLLENNVPEYIYIF